MSKVYFCCLSNESSSCICTPLLSATAKVLAPAPRWVMGRLICWCLWLSSGRFFIICDIFCLLWGWECWSCAWCVWVGAFWSMWWSAGSWGLCLAQVGTEWWSPCRFQEAAAKVCLRCWGNSRRDCIVLFSIPAFGSPTVTAIFVRCSNCMKSPKSPWDA